MIISAHKFPRACGFFYCVTKAPAAVFGEKLCLFIFLLVGIVKMYYNICIIRKRKVFDEEDVSR